MTYDVEVAAGCGCSVCDSARREAKYAEDGNFASFLSRFMILCPDCGNKRCPKATHHIHACTGSNETGQEGSAYPKPDYSAPPPTIEEIEARLSACHCGEPIIHHDDIQPGYTRWMCEHCDSVRCDAFPGACGRTRAAAS